MLNNRPTRTVLVLLGLLAFSSPLEAKKNKTKPKPAEVEWANPDEEAPKSEVPSDLPANANDNRTPARIGPGLNEEALPSNADLVPGDGAPVKLLDGSAESALDSPAERNASSESAAEETTAAIPTPVEKTEEDIRANERLREMEAEQKARNEKESETAAEDEAKAAALAEAKADAEKAQKEKSERADNGKSRKTAEDEPDGKISITSHNYTWQSPRHFGLDILFAPTRYPSLLLGTSGASNGVTGNGARVNFEWMFFQGGGKVSVGAGFHFSNIPRTTNSAGESLVVNTLGGELALTYRADFIQHQLLVPFARVGMDLDYVVQSNDDGGTASQGSYHGTLYGGGLELCLFFIERRNARLLDRKFGINDTFLVLEYIKSVSNKAGSSPDLSHDEFRIGLRFEI